MRAITPTRAAPKPARGPTAPVLSVESQLLAGMTEAVARHGFAAVRVVDVLAAAGVSRSSFYGHFRDVEDCFLHAYRWHTARLVGELAAAVATSDRPELTVLDALTAEATARPQAARFLMLEGLASGPRGLARRESLVAGVAGLLDAGAMVTDVPRLLLVGAAFRYLARQLSVGHVRECAREDLRAWAETFARSPGAERWSPLLIDFQQPSGRSSWMRGGHVQRRAPHRERVLIATAALVRSIGYRAATVADIVATARVSRRTFYNNFPDKSEAFIAAYEHGFERTLAAVTPAFFSTGTWPERLWRSGVAFTGYLAREPLLAHLGLTQCHSLGPRFARRVLETQLAFTLFLEEGYQQPSARARGVSRACSDLTSAGIVELAHHAVHRGSALQLRTTLPLATYLSLAPFIGVDEAGAFALSHADAVGTSAARPNVASGAAPAVSARRAV